MRRVAAFYTGLIIYLLTACTGGKYLEQKRAGENYYDSGNYVMAYETASRIINEIEAKGKEADAQVYYLAGASAYELQDYGTSLDYLEKAGEKEFSNEGLFLYLAGNYRQIDNLSREITALTTYLERYPAGTEAARVRSRLFRTCLESENYALADRLWAQMDSSSREEIPNLDARMQMAVRQERNELADSLAPVLTGKDPENETALSYLAEKHFWLAENTYMTQMKAYKANRTHRQYAILLEAFKQVNADFKKSLAYFNRLYSLHPRPEYAGYLSNIHLRLEDKAKSEYYRKKANL